MRCYQDPAQERACPPPKGAITRWRLRQSTVGNTLLPYVANERPLRGGPGWLARASSRARGVRPLLEGTGSRGLGRSITNGCVGGKYNQGCGAPASGHRDMTKVTQCAMLTDYRAQATLGTHDTS